MAHRNYGLGHLRSSRATETRANSPGGLSARLLYSVERALEGVHHGFSKRDSLPRNGIPVRIVAEYMGRVIFHVGEVRMVPQESLTRVRGEK